MKLSDLIRVRAKIRAATTVPANAERREPGHLVAVNDVVSVPSSDHWVYVRLDSTGKIIQARNYTIQPVEGWPVYVIQTADEPLPSVIDRYTGGNPRFVRFPQHNHDLFDPFNGSPQWVDQAQFLPLLVTASNTSVSVLVHAGLARVNELLLQVPAQVLDLASYVPVSGARWVLLTVGSNSSVNVTLGSEVVSRNALFSGYILASVPDVPNGELPIALVTLYSGMTAVTQTATYTDVFDLRFTNASKTGGNAVTVHTVTGDSTTAGYQLTVTPGGVTPSLNAGGSTTSGKSLTVSNV